MFNDFEPFRESIGFCCLFLTIREDIIYFTFVTNQVHLACFNLLDHIDHIVYVLVLLLTSIPDMEFS